MNQKPLAADSAEDYTTSVDTASPTCKPLWAPTFDLSPACAHPGTLATPQSLSCEA